MLKAGVFFKTVHIHIIFYLIRIINIYRYCDKTFWIFSVHIYKRHSCIMYYLYQHTPIPSFIYTLWIVYLIFVPFIIYLHTLFPEMLWFISVNWTDIKAPTPHFVLFYIMDNIFEFFYYKGLNYLIGYWQINLTLSFFIIRYKNIMNFFVPVQHFSSFWPSKNIIWMSKVSFILLYLFSVFSAALYDCILIYVSFMIQWWMINKF